VNVGVRATLVQALSVAENNVGYHAQRVKDAEALRVLHVGLLDEAQQRVAELRHALEETA
jgi:hypothetical protein